MEDHLDCNLAHVPDFKERVKTSFLKWDRKSYGKDHRMADHTIFTVVHVIDYYYY